MSSNRGSHRGAYRDGDWPHDGHSGGGGGSRGGGGRGRYQGERGGGRGGRGRGGYYGDDGREWGRYSGGGRDQHDRNGHSNQSHDGQSHSRRGGRDDYSNGDGRRDAPRWREGPRSAAPFSPRSPRSDWRRADGQGNNEQLHNRRPPTLHADDQQGREPPHPATLPTEPVPPPPPQLQAPLPPPFSLDLFPEDHLKLIAIQGLMQPYLPFWIQPLPALDDHQPSNWTTINPIPHFVHTCCNSLSQWLLDTSPQVMTRWLVDTWLALHPLALSLGTHKESAKLKLFDAVWTVWATAAPVTQGHRVEPAAVVAGALAALASVLIQQQQQQQPGASTFDPASTMPFAALVHLVDFKSPSALHTLVADPVLRQLPAMDMAAAGADSAMDNDPPPSKRPRHHRDRDRHHSSSSRHTASIPPAIPPHLPTTLTYSIAPTQISNLTLFFSRLLAFSPLLDPLRDLLLVQTSDPRLKLALLDAFIAHCASPTTPAGHASLDRSATSLAHLYTDASTLGGTARSLLRHLPMAHLAAHAPLLAILHAYFAQPTTRVAPHLLFADVTLSAQAMLDLMLALASSPTPTWMHHVLIPVFDSLVGAVDLAAVPLAAWDVFCHVLDTPVLARGMLRQLQERDGPVVAAVRRVVGGYEAAEAGAADGQVGVEHVKADQACAHGQPPAAWPGSADDVPLMLREWTWRWTSGRTAMDPGVIEHLVRVDFSGLPALADMQLKVVAKQVARLVDAGGSATADELVQRLVHVLMAVEHAPREAARVLAVVLGAVAKDHGVLEGVLARGLFNAFAGKVDEGDDPGRELTPAECTVVLERMVPMLLNVPMCTQQQQQQQQQPAAAEGDQQHLCPVVHGLVSMLFGSNKTFGLVLHRVFHYATPDIAQQFLAWLAQLAAIVPPARAGQIVGISSETIAGAILYTANADVRKASGMARVLEQIGRCMLLGAGTLSTVDGVDAVIAVRAELYDYLLFEFFKEFTRLADKRVALESVHSLWNRNARSSDGHLRGAGGFGESVTEKEMVSLGIDTLAVAPAILDPASARRPPSQSDWAHATKAAAAALTHLHQRLDHLAVGFTVLYSAWDLQQIDLMLSATGLHAHPSGRVPLVTHIVNVLTMTGTHPETGISWSFPSPYLLQVLARIGTDASCAFVTIIGHQLADQLDHCEHVPNAIVNAAYKAVYAVLISALQHKQDPAAQVPFALLVRVFSSVLMVDKELWPMWQRAVESVPEMRREEVTRDMYQELVRRVLGPVEQRAAVDLWWCTVEGMVRRKVPMPM